MRLVISRKTVLCLGFAQLISWGVAYYLIGGFGEAIAADLGWSGDKVYGGFALALLVMGLASQPVGRLIDVHGGRRAMIAGALVVSLGCVLLALCRGEILYYAAWIVLGLAMRLTLYDAAFAALARIGGPGARGPMSQITLLGGLASTVFWPFGHFLADHLGWRGAVLIYAAIALMMIPLLIAIPERRYADAPAQASAAPNKPLAATRGELVIASALYALIATLTNFLNAGMSSHMIVILNGLGLAATTAVWIATLRGVGQSSARLAEVLFGKRIHPLTLNVLTCALLPCCFVAGFFGGVFTPAAIAFALIYGVSNGIVTITRGTMPLVLFDHRTYGAFVGRLLAPSFVISASAPLLYALVIDHFGERGALAMSLCAALTALAASLILKMMFDARLRERRSSPP
jgi:MFS family permease